MNVPFKTIRTLNIAAGQMPAQGTVWWSGAGAADVGGTTGNETGIISIGGHKADEAIVVVKAAAFDGQASLLFRAQQKDAAAGWEDIDPPLVLVAPATALRYLDVSAGVAVLAAAAGRAVQIRVPLSGDGAFRFGLECSGAGARATVAVQGWVRLVARHLYS
jgi:hypothetical protein